MGLPEHDPRVAGEHSRTTFATEALRAAYQANTGSEPVNQVAGDTGAGGGALPFKSMNELTHAMQDRRYTSGDPAYHAEIDRRIKASPSIFS